MIEAKVAQVAQKVVENTGKSGFKDIMPDGQNSRFMQTLDKQSNRVDLMRNEMLESFNLGGQTHPADSAVSVKDFKPSASRIQSMDAVQSKDRMSAMLTDLNHNNLQMEHVMERITSGARMDNRELLMLQAMMHQLTFKSEMAVRVMDAGRGTINTLVTRTTQ